VSAGEEELRELVHKYRVIWESRPELAVSGDALVPVGFVVELAATHDHPRHPPTAGCDECAPVERALARLASAVLPRGVHASWYDIHVSSGALQFDRTHRDGPELSATISVLHHGDVNRPPDDCQRACLAEIRSRLIELGAQERRWTKRDGAS